MTITAGQPMSANDFLKNHTDPANPGNDENKGVKLNQDGLIEREFLPKHVPVWENGIVVGLNDLVAHNGAVWKSLISNNSSEPQVIFQGGNMDSIDFANKKYNGLTGNYERDMSVYKNGSTSGVFYTQGQNTLKKRDFAGEIGDVSNMSAEVSYTIANTGTQIWGVDFAKGGTKMYLKVNDNNIYIREFDLATPFDPNTATYTGRQRSLGSYSYYRRGGIFISEDGLYLYYWYGAAGNSAALYRYNFGTAYQINTVAYSQSRSLGYYAGIVFAPNGDTYYTVDSSNYKRAWEHYNCNPDWAITSYTTRMYDWAENNVYDVDIIDGWYLYIGYYGLYSAKFGVPRWEGDWEKITN